MTRSLLAIAVFIELLVLFGLGAILVGGGLPESLALLVWLIGAVVALSAAIAFGLPGAWVEKLSLHGALISGSVIFALPFVWLVGTSFKYPEETFVYPPRWLPEVATAASDSPYIAMPSTSFEGDEAQGDAVWSAAKPLIPAEELALVDDDEARDAMLGAMRVTDASRVNAEAVKEAWGRVFRAVMLGTVSVTDEAGRVFAVPFDRLSLDVMGGAELMALSPGRGLVKYQLSGDASALEARIVIDDDWLSQTLEGRALSAVSVSMRQDRTWHALSAELRSGGRRWRSEDALYLGEYRWRELTFRRAETSQRDQRELGVFPVTTDVDAPVTMEHTPWMLTLRVEQSGPIGGTWAKYTQNYRDAWYADEHWPNYLFNSAWLVALNVIGQLFACSMVAYAFARLSWPGRDTLFVVLLSTMMLPAAVTMVPVFLIWKSLGMYNTLLPLWLPAFFGTPFFIFLLRQFMLGLPRELEEAARLDGCSWLSIYWRIVLPLMKPALAAVAIFTFMGTWNEFMGPLIYLSDERLYPLSLGLFTFRGQNESAFGLLMAASTLMTLPVVALFFLCQRYFIQGVTLTGLKG